MEESKGGMISPSWGSRAQQNLGYGDNCGQFGLLAAEHGTVHFPLIYCRGVLTRSVLHKTVCGCAKQLESPTCGCQNLGAFNVLYLARGTFRA